MITVKTRDGEMYSTSGRLPERIILEETFHYHESSRAIRFELMSSDEMFIPFENIQYVTKTKKDGDKYKTTIEKDLNE
jgi:hypothetical protein